MRRRQRRAEPGRSAAGRGHGGLGAGRGGGGGGDRRRRDGDLHARDGHALGRGHDDELALTDAGPELAPDGLRVAVGELDPARARDARPARDEQVRERRVAAAGFLRRDDGLGALALLGAEALHGRGPELERRRDRARADRAASPTARRCAAPRGYLPPGRSSSRRSGRPAPPCPCARRGLPSRARHRREDRLLAAAGEDGLPRRTVRRPRESLRGTRT